MDRLPGLARPHASERHHRRCPGGDGPRRWRRNHSPIARPAWHRRERRQPFQPASAIKLGPVRSVLPACLRYNWDALHRKVTEAPLIPAMVPLRDGSTAETSWHRVALGLDNPLISGPADRVDGHRRTGRADAFLCHDLHPAPRRTTRHYHHQLCASPSIAATRQTQFDGSQQLFLLVKDGADWQQHRPRRRRTSPLHGNASYGKQAGYVTTTIVCY